MTSKKQNADLDFQRWWNEKKFYTDDTLYQTYRKLHAAGAELDYIEFIRAVFAFGALFDPVIQRNTLRRARRRMKKASRKNEKVHILARQIENLHSNVKEKDPKPMVVLGELQATLEFLHKEPHSTPALFADYIGALMETRTTAEEQQLPPEAIKFLDPLVRICLKLKILRLPEKGHQPDPIGDFVLLAVSEHLRQKHPGRPGYGLAAEFLRKLHSGSEPSASSTKVRVHQLKCLHPQWDELLLFAMEQYQEIKNDAERVRLAPIIDSPR